MRAAYGKLVHNDKCIYMRNSVTPCCFTFHILHNSLLSVVTGKLGRASARTGTSVAGGTYRGSTRSSDDYKVAAAN